MANDRSSGFPAMADLDLDHLLLLPPSSLSSTQFHLLHRLSSSLSSAHIDLFRFPPSSSSSSPHSLDVAPPSLPAFPPLPPREELESVLDVLKSPSREDLVWLDSLTPVSSSNTPGSAEELMADLVTPASTPGSTPAEESKSHLWPFNALQSVAAEAPDCVAQYSPSDIAHKQIQTKKHPRTVNRKLLPPLSPKALSPRSDASVRSADRRREYGTSIPFNFKVSTKDEAMYDGYRWQKYCKKAIKESPFPRFYFKCASRNCTARKQVQHSVEDPNVVFTTYEGTHNHDRPSSLPVGVIISGGACMCPSSRVLPCLNCLGNDSALQNRN